MTVGLSSDSAGGTFRNTGDTADVTSVTIASGQSTASFRYRDSVVGTPTLTASSTGLTSVAQQESVVANSAPPVPTLSSPINNAATTDQTPTFSWTSVTDPNGDPVTYEIQVDDSSDFSSPLSLSPTMTGLTGTSYTTTTTLAIGTTYYWRVRATDGATPSAYSSPFALLVTNTTGSWRLQPSPINFNQGQSFTQPLTITNVGGTTAIACVSVSVPSANFTISSANIVSAPSGWSTTAPSLSGGLYTFNVTRTSGTNPSIATGGGTAVFNVLGTAGAAGTGISWTGAAFSNSTCTTTFGATNEVVTTNVSGQPPSLDLDGAAAGTGFEATFTEAAGAASITNSANVSVTDTDSTNMASATATLAATPDGTSESLGVTAGSCSAITPSYNTGRARR